MSEIETSGSPRSTIYTVTKTSQGKVQALFQQNFSNCRPLPLWRGTLLSRNQYFYDMEKWGNLDPRLRPPASMRLEEIER